MPSRNDNMVVVDDANSGLDVLRIFHGTRRSLAGGIVEHGFQPLSVADQITAVARRYGIAVDALTAHLKAHNRFTHLDERPGTVSMVADRDQAGSWANRAPEATWEALRAAYDLLNPELGDEWNQTGQGRFWVLAQQLIDPPAVISVEVSLTAVHTHPAGKTPAELLEILGAERYTEMLPAFPEWRAAADAVTVTGVHEAPSRLDSYDILFMSESGPDAFNQQVSEGIWGEPGGCDRAGMPWWSFTEIWSRLSDERRTELEAIAGHPLS